MPAQCPKCPCLEYVVIKDLPKAQFVQCTKCKTVFVRLKARVKK